MLKKFYTLIVETRAYNAQDVIKKNSRLSNVKGFLKVETKITYGVANALKAKNLNISIVPVL